MTPETLNTIFTIAVIPLLGALVPFLCAFLTKKTAEVKERANNERLNKYLDIAEDAIETVVVALSQTFVDAVKGTTEWTPEIQKQTLEAAKHRAIIIMGSSARLAIQEAYGDFDTWLEDSIEYYVNKSKCNVPISGTEITE